MVTSVSSNAGHGVSVAGGATAATVESQAPAVKVIRHKLTPINGWTYGGFGSFHPAYYYVDANRRIRQGLHQSRRGFVPAGLAGG